MLNSASCSAHLKRGLGGVRLFLMRGGRRLTEKLYKFGARIGWATAWLHTRRP